MDCMSLLYTDVITSHFAVHTSNGMKMEPSKSSNLNVWIFFLGLLSALAVGSVFLIAYGGKSIPASGKGSQGPPGQTGPQGPAGTAGSAAADPNFNQAITFSKDGSATFQNSVIVMGDLLVPNGTLSVRNVASTDMVTGKKLVSDTTIVAPTSITSNNGYIQQGNVFAASAWTAFNTGKTNTILSVSVPSVDISNMPRIQVLAMDAKPNQTPPIPGGGSPKDGYVYDITNMGNTYGNNGWTATWENSTKCTVSFAKNFWCRSSQCTGATTTSATSYFQIILYY